MVSQIIILIYQSDLQAMEIVPENSLDSNDHPQYRSRPFLMNFHDESACQTPFSRCNLCNLEGFRCIIRHEKLQKNINKKQKHNSCLKKLSIDTYRIDEVEL
jgi:hypothetical protein